LVPRICARAIHQHAEGDQRDHDADEDGCGHAVLL
jgi:hypothetical protein